MGPGSPSFVRPILIFLLIVAGLYGILRTQRETLVDFAVPRTAAMRFLEHETLYRADDGHYQYKYLPAFALVMVPFTWISREAGELTWFTLTVGMTWAFLHLSLTALPNRRRSERVLFWLSLLLITKFLVKELGFGNFNLPFGLLLIGAVIAAQQRRGLAAAAFVAAAVFVKPYALILVPWIALTLGWRPLAVFGLLLVAGLMLPAVSYGWNGNLTLLHDWYTTVAGTTRPNLTGFENISFASMWAKWLQPGPVASILAVISVVVAMAAGVAVILRRQHVAEPNYLEAGYFLVLVPLVSPQGWDYVLLLGLPAYMCLVDRWRDMSVAWRMVALLGFLLTSFTIFDLQRRTIYIFLMDWAAVSVGAVLMLACLIRLRWQAAA